MPNLIFVGCASVFQKDSAAGVVRQRSDNLNLVAKNLQLFGERRQAGRGCPGFGGEILRQDQKSHIERLNTKPCDDQLESNFPDGFKKCPKRSARREAAGMVSTQCSVRVKCPRSAPPIGLVRISDFPNRARSGARPLLRRPQFLG